jgi:hypothetical protein
VRRRQRPGPLEAGRPRSLGLEVSSGTNANEL